VQRLTKKLVLEPLTAWDNHRLSEYEKELKGSKDFLKKRILESFISNLR